MVEATPSIHPQPSVVIATLARQAAMKAAKAQLRERAQAALMSLRELLLLANDYLAQHRDELIAQTWERVQNAPSLRALYDREQRDRQRTLERQRATRLVQRTPNNQTVPGEPVSKTQ